MIFGNARALDIEPFDPSNGGGGATRISPLTVRPTDSGTRSEVDAGAWLQYGADDPYTEFLRNAQYLQDGRVVPRHSRASVIPPGCGSCAGMLVHRRPDDATMAMHGGGFGAPLTTTTDDVDVMVKVLSTNLEGLDKAIVRWYGETPHTPAFDEFAAGWDNFRKQVRAFIFQWQTQGLSYIAAEFKRLTSGGQDPGPPLKLAWNYYDNAKSYIEQNRLWRDKWTKLSGRQPETPDLPTPGATGSVAGTLVKWSLIAGGLAGVFFGGRHLIRKYSHAAGL